MNLSDLTTSLMNQRETGKITPQDSELTFEYVKYLDDVSFDIIQSMSDENFATAISVIQGTIMTKLLQDGSISVKDVKFLMSDEFSEAVAIAFKLSLAIAATEELR